ncbi:MAG: heat-inducible transcription repressor HrcA [Eggerthella lenta]
MLSGSKATVLSALIEEYVARALPVGSRTLPERYQLGGRPATERNELSVLEDGGYITQPHTSAGRIPTDFGYRAFVDNLLASDLAGDDERYRPVVDQLRRSASELDALLEQTSSALTRLTDCLSTLAPSVLNPHIKQLSSSRCRRTAPSWCWSPGRPVFNRQMDFAEEVSPDELARVQRFLAEVMGGKSLQEIEDGLGEGMAEAFRDRSCAWRWTVLSCLQEGDVSRASPRRELASTKPEFASPGATPVMRCSRTTGAAADPRRAARQAGRAQRAHRRENDAPRWRACRGGQPLRARRVGGVVAVVGPTRMDYSKVIQAVRIASAALEDV